MGSCLNSGPALGLKDSTAPVKDKEDPKKKP